MAASSDTSGRWGWVPVLPEDERRGGSAHYVVAHGATVSEGETLGTFQTALPNGRVLTDPVLAPASGVFELDSGVPRVRYCRHPALHGSACVYCGVNTRSLSRAMRDLFERDNAAAAATVAVVPRPHEARKHATASDAGSAGMQLYGGALGYGLRMSAAHASSLDADRSLRLRASRRLVLVLDLDHTLVHATRHPCGGAALAAAARGELSEVHILPSPVPAAAGTASGASLTVPGAAVPGPAASLLQPAAAAKAQSSLLAGAHPTYYIKLRPGVREFLCEAAAQFELHVDTFGTQDYARAVVDILDPSGALFSGRVVSRSDTARFHAPNAGESASAGGGSSRGGLASVASPARSSGAAAGAAGAGGSSSPMPRAKAPSWLHRSLRDHSAVLIVDDTEAAWPGARNLVLIRPYVFWQVSDEFEANNAAGGRHLRQHPQQQLPSDHPPAAVAAVATDPPAEPATAAPAARPEGGEVSSVAATTAADVPPPPLLLWQEEARPVLLADILRVLRAVHVEYFRQVDDAAAAALAASPLPPLPPPPPSTDAILAALLARTLRGTALLFSGVFPTNVDVSRQPLVRRAVAFGAVVVDAGTAVGAAEGSGGGGGRPSAACTTHVVARRPGTAKVLAAVRRGGVRVVHTGWVEACLREYRRVPEAEWPLAPGYERYASVDASAAEAALACWRRGGEEGAAEGAVPPLPELRGTQAAAAGQAAAGCLIDAALAGHKRPRLLPALAVTGEGTHAAELREGNDADSDGVGSGGADSMEAELLAALEEGGLDEDVD